MADSSPSGLSRLETLPLALLESLQRTRVQVGDVLAERFRVVAQLGGGAMGEVFVAENLAIGLSVAIKVLRPELLADAAFRMRFQQEAQAIASIQHPNVVRFLDLVVGVPTFLVMEHVRGVTLSRLMRTTGGPLPPLRAANIVEQLCWGLHAAHRARVIHRDLKPSNILVEDDRDHGELAKIIDFGLAKTITVPDDGPLTRKGEIVGTPFYMAPEQIAGHPVDGRADMYSLGCVAYELVTGRVPFVSEKDELHILYQHVHNAPIPPSRLNPAVSPALDAVILKMLSKAREDRFPSMREAANAIVRSVEKRLRSGSDASARPPASASPRMFALGAIAAFAVAGLGAGAAQLERHRGGAAGKSLLVVDTIPPGARVTVDRVVQPETTPLAVDGLAAGPHTLTIERPGFATVERTVNLAAGARESAHLILPPVQRTVEVVTIPAGAVVYVDKQVIGVAPVRAQVPADDFHEVRVEKDGYETGVGAIKPDDGKERLVVTLNVESHPRGAITVDADRAAEVWIDGAFTGFRAPTIAIQVRAGDHVVELREEGKVLASQAVSVGRGRSIHLTMRANTL